MVSEVVGYARGSTEEQEITLEDQEAKIRRYATDHCLHLVEMVVDRGASGKTLKRPGLKRALALLDDGLAGGIIVSKLDRFTRSILDFERLIESHFGSKRPHQLISAETAIDTKTSTGLLPLRIMMVFYQSEREAIVDRTAGIMARKRINGEQLGTVPLGKVRDSTSSKLVDSPEDLATIRLIHQLAGAGLTLGQIARNLDLDGVKPKKGGSKWARSTVAKVLARPCPA